MVPGVDNRVEVGGVDLLDCIAGGGQMAAKATTPLSVGQPAWSVLTLVVTGTPCSGPSASPRACTASAAAAAANASSSRMRTTALIAGFTACSRARQDWVASQLEARPSRISLASSVASRRHRSPVIAGPCERL
jgi:hypothetical protein